MSTAGMGVAYGFRPGMRYVWGLMLGQNIVILLFVTGLAALIFALPWIRVMLLIGSSAYLLYLAVKIAFAGAQIGFIQAIKPPGLLDGIILQPINPKAYVVMSTLFSGFPFWPDAYWTEVGVKWLLLHIIWLPIHMAWLYAGVTLERLHLPPRVQRGVNIAMACAMLAVVGLALLSTQG